MSTLSLGLPRSRTHPRAPPDRDSIVQSTDNDAASSRLSAVRTGYLQDAFAGLFSPPVPPKLPIINRGTYVRTTTIDRLVDAFLAPPSPPSTPTQASPSKEEKTTTTTTTTTTRGRRRGRRRQIISLGAGTDTRFFRLRTADPELDVVYHELDFPAVTRRKVATINGTPSLRRCIAGDVETDDATGSLHGDNYHLHGVDLRSLLKRQQDGDGEGEGKGEGEAALRGLETDVQTLLISECCLVYLTPDEAEGVVEYFTSRFQSPAAALGIIVYEPINGKDSFGRVMISNLASRGIELKTLSKYNSLSQQRERMRTAGFEGVEAADVDWLWEHWVEAGEKERVGRCEFLDEVEEWRLLAKHYAIVWAWRGEGWEGWRDLKGQEQGEKR